MTYNRGNVYVKNHIFYDVRSFVSAVRSDDVDGCFFFAWEALGCCAWMTQWRETQVMRQYQCTNDLLGLSLPSSCNMFFNESR